jgi:hypothetical protein
MNSHDSTAVLIVDDSLENFELLNSMDLIVCAHRPRGLEAHNIQNPTGPSGTFVTRTLKEIAVVTPDWQIALGTDCVADCTPP